MPALTRNAITWGAVLLILVSIFLICTLGLASGVRFDVPFTYEGDGLEYNLLTKTMIETGWWLENPMVGAPGKLEMYDYPVGNNLDFLIMKILSIFSGNYAVVMNMYYILGFFLTAFSSLFVFRQIRISYLVAVFGSVLYTFLYYHFCRLGHFNLVAYYMIPLIILVILWVCQGEPLFIRRTDENSPGIGLTWSITPKGIISFIIILITSTQSYYGFFAIFFLIIATLWSASRSYDLAALINGIVTGVLLIAGLTLNKLPSLLYTLSHGPSFAMIYRYPNETEIYGLKLIQLILPAPGHNIPFFSEIAQKYTEYRPLVNENVSATLGIIGTAGFLLLLFWVFLRGWQPLNTHMNDRVRVMDHLSLLTISALFIGTIGGISAIVAEFFPEIHAYNRISLFIAFFAILAVALVLHLIFDQYRTKSFFCPLFLILLLLIVTFGVYDQVPASFTLTAGSDRETQFLAQDEYFSQIEAGMPSGASVFILPDTGGFPNSDSQYRVTGAESMIPYLHTRSIRWSYPTMRDRFWDTWQIEVTNSEPKEILGHLFMTEFTGLLIDGYGYSDDGTEAVRTYTNITRITPFMSKDGRYAFFDLTGLMEQKRSGMSMDQFKEKQQEYLNRYHSRYPDLK